MTALAPNPYGNVGYRLVTANALRDPDQVAVVHEGQRITFGQLEVRVNRMANALLAAGVKSGTRVASLLHDTLNIVDVYLAESKIGATIAAMNPFWTPEVMSTVAGAAAATTFVYDAHFADVVAGLRTQLPAVERWLALDVAADDTTHLRSLASGASDSAPELSGFYDDEWMFLYTSGTTGLPKAVVHSHATGLGVAGIWTDVSHSRHSVWGVGPIIYGAGFPSVVGCAFSGGLGVAVENDFSPANAIKVIERERLTHLAVVVSFFTEIFKNDDHERYDLDSLEVIILGSEPIPPSLLERIRARLPKVELYSFYGSAEAMYTTFGRLDDGSQDLRSSGRARAGCAVKVVDQDGRRVIDEIGTLCHAGPHIMCGYLDQDDVNAEVLRDGWYVGEDLGVQRADGTIMVLGRRSDAISSSGQWVQPAEVEEAALSIAGVAEAGAVGVPEAGDDQRILLAVAPRAGATLDETEILTTLKGLLPGHMVPSAVVVAESLPHNEQAAAGTGKLLRSEIRRRWADRVTP